MEREEALVGGNLSGAVRVGDTVRRATGPWTPAVHALLRYLETVGFVEAPRVLGIDDLGREILTFLEGDAADAHDPWPSWTRSTDALHQAGATLRRYHDLVADFEPPPDPVWRFTTGAPEPGGVICHNDWGPYNVAWRDDRIYGVFDWDVAGPGDREQDLAFAAWQWVPLHHPGLLDDDVSHQGERLRQMCDAYGLEDRAGFAARIPRRAEVSVERILRGAEAGDPGCVSLRDGGHVAEMQRTVAHLEATVGELQAAIT